MRISCISHSPRECRKALLGATGPVIIDTETTGLEWYDRIVSVGVLVDSVAYILFVRSTSASVAPYQISIARLRRALQPLRDRPDLTTVFHNSVYDLGKLLKDGIEISGTVHDTIKLLKLVDSDRGRDLESYNCRWDRRFKEPLNYKLKDLARVLLNVEGIDTPDASPMASVGYREHTDYLASDLYLTGCLYEHILERIPQEQLDYCKQLVAPLTCLLARMTFDGIQADAEYLDAQVDRCEDLMQQLRTEHGGRFPESDHELDRYILWTLGVKPEWNHPRTKRGLLSLKQECLEDLIERAKTEEAKRSLRLIADYRLIKERQSKLVTLWRSQRVDSRIHSMLDDKQMSGRISSSNPNLQGVAGTVRPGGKKSFKSELLRDQSLNLRDGICASPGFTLVAFDISQADIRVLAHITEAMKLCREEYLRKVRVECPDAAQFQQDKWEHFKGAAADREEFPEFDPLERCNLLEDFKKSLKVLKSRPKGLKKKPPDFYKVAAKRMLGEEPEDTERNKFKQTILSIVNGKSIQGLAETLDVSLEEARDCLDRFIASYPKVWAFRELMFQGFAVSGEAKTLRGKPRIVSGHRWMVSRTVDLVLKYRDGWLRVKVVPLYAGRRTLTCRVLKVVDTQRGSASENRVLYTDQQGRVGLKPHRFFSESKMFRLPYRNIPWAVVRRVLTESEEVSYSGFDKTCRELFNHLCQGGTADVAKRMMLRADLLCREFGARLLLQIHDELLFECPSFWVEEFLHRMWRLLEREPFPDFLCPMVVEPKVGQAFGSLLEWPR